MKIIVDHTSMQPIYEQIVEQIKKQILQGTLREGAPLDSVRMLAKDLKVSALLSLIHISETTRRS